MATAIETRSSTPAQTSIQQAATWPWFVRVGPFLVASLFLTATVAYVLFATTIRYGMLRQFLTVALEKMNLGEERILSWMVAPIFGSSTEMTELYAGCVCVAVILVEAAAFHALVHAALAVRDLGFLGARNRFGFLQDTTVDGADRLALARYLARRKLLAWVLAAAFFVPAAVLVGYGDWNVAALRCLYHDAQVEAEQDFTTLAADISIQDIPPLEAVLRPHDHGVPEAVAQARSSLRRTILLVAWGETLMLGFVPGLALALAVLAFTATGWSLISSLGNALREPIFALSGIWAGLWRRDEDDWDEDDRDEDDRDEDDWDEVDEEEWGEYDDAAPDHEEVRAGSWRSGSEHEDEDVRPLTDDDWDEEPEGGHGHRDAGEDCCDLHGAPVAWNEDESVGMCPQGCVVRCPAEPHPRDDVRAEDRVA